MLNNPIVKSEQSGGGNPTSIIVAVPDSASVNFTSSKQFTVTIPHTGKEYTISRPVQIDLDSIIALSIGGEIDSGDIGTDTTKRFIHFADVVYPFTDYPILTCCAFRYNLLAPSTYGYTEEVVDKNPNGYANSIMEISVNRGNRTITFRAIDVSEITTTEFFQRLFSPLSVRIALNHPQV